MPYSPIKVNDGATVLGPECDTETLHGSSKAGWEAVRRNLQNAEAGKTISGDQNQDFYLLETINNYCRQLGTKKLAITRDPFKLQQIINNIRTTVKFRIGGAQLVKMGEVVAKCVEGAFPLEDLPTLAQGTQCSKIILTQHPDEFKKRDELLALTKGQPTFAKFGNRVFFITTIGTFLDVRSNDGQKTQVQFLHIDPKRVVQDKKLAPKYEGKLTYVSYLGQVSLINGLEKPVTSSDPLTITGTAEEVEKFFTTLFISTDQLDATPEDCELLAKHLPADILGTDEKMLLGKFDGLGTNTLTNASDDVEDITRATGFEPCESPMPLELIQAYEKGAQLVGDFKKLAKGILEKCPLDKLVYEIGELIKKSFKNFRYFYQDPDKNDHPFTITVTDDNVRIDVNSLPHTGSDHFRFPVETGTALHAHIESMDMAYKFLILQHGIKHMQERGIVQEKDKSIEFKAPDNLDAMLKDTKVVVPTYDEEDLAKWGVPAVCWQALMEPVEVLRDFNPLLNVFQKATMPNRGGSSQAGELTFNAHFGPMYNQVYRHPVFNNYNCLLKQPFFGYNPDEASENPELQATKMEKAIVAGIKKLESQWNAIKASILKGYNVMQSMLTDVSVPKDDDPVFNHNGDGFDILRKENGEPYTAEELTTIQIKYILAHIYRQHRDNQNKTITVGLIEAAGQNIKQAMVMQHVSSINMLYYARNSKNKVLFNDQYVQNVQATYNLLGEQVANDPEIQAYIEAIDKDEKARKEQLDDTLRTQVTLGKDGMEVKVSDNKQGREVKQAPSSEDGNVNLDIDLTKMQTGAIRVTTSITDMPAAQDEPAVVFHASVDNPLAPVLPTSPLALQKAPSRELGVFGQNDVAPTLADPNKVDANVEAAQQAVTF